MNGQGKIVTKDSHNKEEWEEITKRTLNNVYKHLRENRPGFKENMQKLYDILKGLVTI